MGDATEFFYEHAGFSYDPATETPDQGRRRCARQLAADEIVAESRGWTVRWSDDWQVGSHRDFYGPDSAYSDGEPDTCEQADLLDADGNFLTGLGCIDDADANYRRVIAAELAGEALAQLRTAADGSAVGPGPRTSAAGRS